MWVKIQNKEKSQTLQFNIFLMSDWCNIVEECLRLICACNDLKKGKYNYEISISLSKISPIFTTASFPFLMFALNLFHTFLK